jgi:hypothetical protein
MYSFLYTSIYLFQTSESRAKVDAFLLLYSISSIFGNNICIQFTFTEGRKAEDVLSPLMVFYCPVSISSLVSNLSSCQQGRTCIVFIQFMTRLVGQSDFPSCLPSSFHVLTLSWTISHFTCPSQHYFSSGFQNHVSNVSKHSIIHVGSSTLERIRI